MSGADSTEWHAPTDVSAQLDQQAARQRRIRIELESLEKLAASRRNIPGPSVRHYEVEARLFESGIAPESILPEAQRLPEVVLPSIVIRQVHHRHDEGRIDFERPLVEAGRLLRISLLFIEESETVQNRAVSSIIFQCALEQLE